MTTLYNQNQNGNHCHRHRYGLNWFSMANYKLKKRLDSESFVYISVKFAAEIIFLKMPFHFYFICYVHHVNLQCLEDCMFRSKVIVKGDNT